MFQIGPTIRVEQQGRPPADYPVHTRVRELPDSERDARGLDVLGALVNNEVVTMAYRLEVDSEVRLLTVADRHGWRIYRHSLAFLLARTVRELFPAAAFAVEHSLGTGLYCSIAFDGVPGIDPARLARLAAAMRETVARDVPIERRKIAYRHAVEQFRANGQSDKYDLLRFRNPAKIVLYECGGFADLAHSVLAHRTGALGHFDLIAHPPGFVLQLPDRERAPALAPFDPQPHLFQIFQEHKEWGRILGLRNVGDLNRHVANDETAEIVRIAEALHEKKLAQLADRIAAQRGRVKWILVAGPSSSGKTTFAKRLSVQLRVNGLRPVAISVDDYFVDRERTPRDEQGEPDFEHLETVDLDLLNRHLAALDRGEEIELPSFDFATGRRVAGGRRLRLEPDQLALVEGIHALNPRLTAAVPAERKFRVYVSALTQLNLDDHNRISTTDNRLLRRLVRDHRYRGNDALTTLRMWPSVRRGERTWIFPYQKEADATFNTALDYELAILKYLAEPLLTEVKPWDETYAEARRLMSFLDCFLAAPMGVVPPTSILREFIGRSGFRY